MATYKVKGISDMRIGYVSGGIVYEDVPFGTEVAIEADVADVTFEGDGQAETLYYDAEITGNFAADKFKNEILQRIFDKTTVSAGLPADVASRQYVGESAELEAGYFELGVTLDAINDATGAAASLRITVFKCQPAPYVQENIANRTKMGMRIQWSAIRTTTDINSDALPSVPTGGAIYAIDVLS